MQRTKAQSATAPITASEQTRAALATAMPLTSTLKPPTHRLLRGYAFDPSLTTRLDTALVSTMTYKIPWEPLQAGPIGEYIEVVDYDPASGCFYAPIDLNHPNLLAQNGLPPSESIPQFHQQMVYAVAMTTIDRFERALGRKAFWADRPDPQGRVHRKDCYVPRLRIYPHALRMANAYYSRQRGALLFGYFPATEDRSSGQYPGGMVFTCLSHDVVAHETTHALLDGFHPYFMEATNNDVLAFHEAFADIVALFQHFSFPEVLVHQLAKTRGDLGNENLLAQLATQFGHARGMHGALRDAIGHYDPTLKQWVQHRPEPGELDATTEVHARGAIFVAAVFDAFLSIYRYRTEDLLRIARESSGLPRTGEFSLDLIHRLAEEAAKAAGHVLNMCIRALDYCPPVDLTFGEYLRALITADSDLMPEDRHGYRVAFIEAFRRRGIYPRGMRTLSEESLRWSRPHEDPKFDQSIDQQLKTFVEKIHLREHVEKLRYTQDRQIVWQETRRIRDEIQESIRLALHKAPSLQRLVGVTLRSGKTTAGVQIRQTAKPAITVHALREARRQREDGRILNQVFITILQEVPLAHDGQSQTIRAGSTLVLDLDEIRVMYAIRKGLHDPTRLLRTVAYKEGLDDSADLAMTYFGDRSEPLAALHRTGA